MQGGEPFGAVALEAPDANHVVRKHVAAVISRLSSSFGSAMEQPLYQWMADMLTGMQSARNGALVF